MRGRAEAGQTSTFIVGLAVVLAGLVAVVVDASAAYLQRQGLANLADSAALFAAEGGAEGDRVYTDGLAVGEPLGLDDASADAAATSYLRGSGAWDSYPGLRADVRVADGRVVVRLRAPLDLPLGVPGIGDTASVGATGSAVVRVLP